MKAKIINSNKTGSPFYTPSYETTQQLMEWIQYQKSKKVCPWGKVSHDIQVLSTEQAPYNSQKTGEITLTNQETQEDELYYIYTIDDEFTVEYIDDSQEKIDTQLEIKAENDFRFCELLKRKVHVRNSSKTLSYDDFLNMEVKYERIEKLINRAAVNSLKYQLENTEVDDKMYTQEDKDYYLNLVMEYLNA